jgi:hypothetical protein
VNAQWWRTWWAHFEFTRINIEPIILKNKIEDARKVSAFVGGACSFGLDACDELEQGLRQLFRSLHGDVVTDAIELG